MQRAIVCERVNRRFRQHDRLHTHTHTHISVGWVVFGMDVSRWQVLLEGGADVNGQTDLHRAARNGHEAAVKVGGHARVCTTRLAQKRGTAGAACHYL